MLQKKEHLNMINVQCCLQIIKKKRNANRNFYNETVKKKKLLVYITVKRSCPFCSLLSDY